MKKNREKINIKYNFLAFIDALRSKHTLKTLTNLIKELPRVKKNFQRIKKYGFKHIFKYLSYEIFGGHIIKRYYDKKNIVKPIDHKNKFKKITIDTTYFNTELCEIGIKYNSDRTPHNPNRHRHAYSGIYHFLFHGIRNNELNVAEIGIYKNDGMKMFRDYFKNANLYGYELLQNHIDNAEKDNLYNTKYFRMEVNDPSSIKSGLEKCPDKFDIIIDDSSHIFEHQINIIFNSYQYLKKGGYLIIEDIFNDMKIQDEKNYYDKLEHVKKQFSEIYFIQSEHLNRWSPLYNNDKLLVLIKS